MEIKRGRQTPTQGCVLPYTDTRGQEAIDLYNKTGRKAQEWQELLVYDIMATNEEGLWTHTKFGLSVPRRNGKNEVVIMIELAALVDGKKVLHTAHRTTTSHAAWVRLCNMLEAAGYGEKIVGGYVSTKQYGLEKITMDKGGGEIHFRTRSAKGGLGEGFDLLIIDEAQEYTDDQETALKYVVSDSLNPQIIFCGTPPTAVSAGTVFKDLRDAALSGGAVNTGWAEWSLPEIHEDVYNRDLWYETNPSLGTILTERKILDEIGKDTLDYNIQRLGYWTSYSLKSEISEAEWMELKTDALPELKGQLYVGIKYAQTGASVSMSIAVRTEKGEIFVEAIDCQSVRNGDAWILAFLSQADVAKVVIDGAGAQTILEGEMKEARISAEPVLPTVKEVVVANAAFRKAIDDKAVLHAGQPSLVQSVTNCEKRSIGTGGGYGFRSILEDADISLMDSAILAYWICSISKEKKKQKIRC